MVILRAGLIGTNFIGAEHRNSCRKMMKNIILRCSAPTYFYYFGALHLKIHAFGCLQILRCSAPFRTNQSCTEGECKRIFDYFNTLLGFSLKKLAHELAFLRFPKAFLVK